MTTLDDPLTEGLGDGRLAGGQAVQVRAVPPSPVPAICVVSRPPDSARRAGAVATVLLQCSHRLAAVALFAMVGTVACLYLGKQFHTPLAVAAGAADVGLCAALAAGSVSGPDRREAIGATAFNGSVAALSLVLILVARAGVVQETVRRDGGAARASLRQFFTPPAELPNQE